MSPGSLAQEPHPRLAGLFGIDLRSLAAFRIGLGCLLLWDLYGRSKTLRMDYTGEGAYPREVAEKMRPDSPLFHVFLWSDRVDVQTALFVVFGLLALCLAIGWRTRLVSVLSFLFLASLVRRNHWACHTGDVWLKALSFWAMFLPLGAHLSVDRLRGRARPASEPRVLGPATAGVLLQIGIFYVMAGYLKSRYDVWTRGDAVAIFANVIEYTRPFGAWLGEFPGACRFLTYATLVLEGLSPFLLFCPLGTARIRTGLFVVLAAFHLTLQASIHIGIFQLICIVAMTLFLPGSTWDALGRLVPRSLAQAFADGRASLRRRFGRPDSLGAPAATLARTGRWLEAAFLTSAMVVIVASNVNSAVRDPYDREDRGPVPLPGWVDDYGRQMSLVQSWNMFTDIDRLFFGWFLVLGRQEDGTIVDVLEDRPFQGFAFPEHYARTFPNHNSRRYWREVAQPDRAFLQKPLCDYLAREWEAAGRTPLTHMAIFHVGGIPGRGDSMDQVKTVCAEWEAAHEPLAQAAPAVRERWVAARDSWKAFLQALPRRVPARNH